MVDDGDNLFFSVQPSEIPKLGTLLIELGYSGSFT